MGKFIRSLDPSWIRGIVAIIFSIALVIGFFQGIVPVDIIKDLSLIALSFYFAKGANPHPTKTSLEQYHK